MIEIISLEKGEVQTSTLLGNKKSEIISWGFHQTHWKLLPGQDKVL